MAVSPSAGATGSKHVTRVLIPFVLLASVWLVLEASGVHAKLAQTGSKTVDMVLNYSSHSRNLRGRNLQESKKSEGAASSPIAYYVWQLIYGACYSFLVVQKYPALTARDDRKKAAEIQDKSECGAFFSTSPVNMCLSCCCIGPRAAHTFDKTGVMNYWIALLAMTFCQCFTLCWANAFTNLNEELGGQKRDCCQSMICAFCCSPCVVAQDAQALDDITSVHVGCCGVTGDNMGAAE